MLDDNEVCKVLEGWSIFVTPDELKSAFFKDPHDDFFELLKQWPWILDTEEVKEKFYGRIQETAKKIGFKTTRPPLQAW